MTISKRAKLLQSKPSAIIEGFKICSSDPYTSENPGGYLNFGVAENHLVDDYMIPKINESIELFSHHMHYSTLYGIESIRETTARFFEKYLGLKNVDAENIIIQSGVSAICECLSFALFDADDVIMIPAPYYTGFDHDFTKRFNCKFLKVDLNPENNFVHDISLFQKAYDEYEDQGKIKAVLICHPHNPSGEILSLSFMDEIISFCADQKLVLLSDEIYALSNHNKAKHVSLFQKAIDKGVMAHFMYGMAKDFALGGMKVGYFYSTNVELIESMQDLSYFHPVSTQTQELIGNILGDDLFLEKYLPQMQQRLKNTAGKLFNALIPNFKVIPTKAGLFMLLDASVYCTNFEDEKELFNKWLLEYKINFTPGKELGLSNPGYFRICFAQSDQAIDELIKRMNQFYSSRSL